MFHRFVSSDHYTRTSRDQYALARSDVSHQVQLPSQQKERHLCRVRLLLSALIHDRQVDRSYQIHVALVDFFEPLNPTHFPWGTSGVDAGIKQYRQDRTITRFIPMTFLQAPTIVVPLPDGRGHPCLFAVSCDVEGPEPEYWANKQAGNEAGDAPS
jgi:hypothetical protein